MTSKILAAESSAAQTLSTATLETQPSNKNLSENEREQHSYNLKCTSLHSLGANTHAPHVLTSLQIMKTRVPDEVL